jgi:hypothetical protein
MSLGLRKKKFKNLKRRKKEENDSDVATGVNYDVASFFKLVIVSM